MKIILLILTSFIVGCASNNETIVEELKGPYFVDDLSIDNLDISASTQVVRNIGWRNVNNKKVFLLTIYSSSINLEKAKQSAFTTGVKVAVGNLIQNAVYVENNNLIYDEIYEYSAGYIDYFSIVETRRTDSKTEVLINLMISESKLARKVLGSTKVTGELDGNVASERLKSYKLWFKNSVSLLNQILSDFPEKAISLEIVSSELVLIPNTLKTKLDLVVVLGWRSEFFDNFYEISSKTFDSENQKEDGRYLKPIRFKDTDNIFDYYLYKQKSKMFDKTFNKIPLIVGNILDKNGLKIFEVKWCLEDFKKSFIRSQINRAWGFLFDRKARMSWEMSAKFSSEDLIKKFSKIDLAVKTVPKGDYYKVCKN